jgi:hypothetical protein
MCQKYHPIFSPDLMGIDKNASAPRAGSQRESSGKSAGIPLAPDDNVSKFNHISKTTFFCNFPGGSAIIDR